MSVAAVLVISVSCYLIKKLIAKGKRIREQAIFLHELETPTTHSTKSGITKIFKREGKKSHELQFFTFESIVSATDNFADSNRLGEGGYGPVYKGKLEDGQEIAIKRLSRSSGQGPLQFKNELVLIAKLQHTNLVRLVGCCIERGEKILIYEYMPNKSLDFFLFTPTGKVILNWKKRFNIIEGIAQGLIYLHKYSRFRIIHRDLKVSNILLDGEMNPKISDFGMARIFGRNESEANTKIIAGTYGYMSPEYAMGGIFSIKSDVYSFGVLLLEIVSGRKNNSYYDATHPVNLAGHAWELWREDRVVELIDQTLGDSCRNNEVLRCIQVGLLCVQDIPADRPTMSDVVSMISNETIPLPAPKQPAFFINSSGNRNENCSLHTVTITELEAR